MHGIMRVQDLIRELETLPMEAPVMIAVVKYPSEFELEISPCGEASWDKSQAVELCPLETGEIYSNKGEITICVELTDYKEEMELNTPGHSSNS